MEYIILFVVALIANGLSAMAGGGAGLLQLPALIFLGLPFSVALGTHKIASVALGLGASSRHLRIEGFPYRLALIVLLAGLPGVMLGARTILYVPEQAARIALGVLTLGLGIYSLSKKTLGDQLFAKNRDARGYCIAAVALFIFGFLNGSLTSGTGLFVTLWGILWWGLDYKRSLAVTMLAVGLGWNLTGALTLSFLAEIKWAWLPVLIVAAFLGGYLGSHIALAKGNRIIKRLFELSTLASGLALILKSI